MKITFVIARASLSGGARVVATYAEHLRKRGHEVLVISTPKPNPTLKQQVKSLVKGKGLIKKKKEPSHLELVDVPHKVINHTPPVIDSDLPDADVVIANWWETAEWVAELHPSKGAKAYFVQHHEIHDYLPKERSAATYKLPLHKITISRWLLEIMRNQYRDNEVDLVPNAVAQSQFCASPRNKHFLPTVGLMYSPVSWKGCDISLQAFNLAVEKIPNLRLVAFGTKQPIEALPLPSGTEYYHQPLQDQIKDIYAACDGWLFGSRCEGFGLPILEAMACRTPVIGTPAGAAPELLSQGGGILVNHEDPEDMARAIERICQLPAAEWQAMSNAAYQTATNYTWEDATDLFEEALSTAIKKSSW